MLHIHQEEEEEEEEEELKWQAIIARMSLPASNIT